MSPEQRTVIEVEGRRLSVSNLDKVLYPEAGFTKADVIWYYVHVAPVLLPHTQGRPLTMTRYPGRGQRPVVLREAQRPQGTRVGPLASASRATPGPTGPDFIEQLVVDDLPTLVWVANLAALELHVPQWRSVDRTALRPRRPDGVRPRPRCAGHRRGVLRGRGLASGRARGPRTRRRTRRPAARRARSSTPGSTRPGRGRRPTQPHTRSPSRWNASTRARCCRTCARTSARARCSSTGARTTPPRRRSRRTRSGPCPSRGLDAVDLGRSGGGARGGGEQLRFLAAEVLERVESLGDLFAPLLDRPGGPSQSPAPPESAGGPKAGAKPSNRPARPSPALSSPRAPAPAGTRALSSPSTTP